MPSRCCYFVDKAAAAGAAPALKNFCSVLHCPAVFTQNLGQTLLKAVAMRGRNADGADYIRAFDVGVASLFERCLKNPSLYSSWDMLMQPVRDAL